MAERHLPHAGHGHAAAGANPEVHHEASDVNIAGIFGFGLGLIVVAAIVHLLIYVLFGFFSDQQASKGAPNYPLAATEENRLPPEPRLQTDPRGDLRDLRNAEEQTLSTYGWVDRNNGVVRIPIDQAMKLTLQRGLPARQEVGR